MKRSTKETLLSLYHHACSKIEILHETSFFPEGNMIFIFFNRGTQGL